MKTFQQGIALLECLISILIFSFGVLGLVGLEARAIKFSVDAEDRNRAALFAGEIASQMWLNGNVNTAMPAALLASVTDPTKVGLSGGAVAINIIPPVAPATVSNSADITVRWHPPSDKATDPDSILTTRVILP